MEPESCAANAAADGKLLFFCCRRIVAHPHIQDNFRAPNPMFRDHPASHSYSSVEA
jgi:hypothetical protein